MDKFPFLTGMGIKNPQQIVRYSVQTSGDHDILRVVYKRDKGSLLPSSKKFKFLRTSKVREEDNGGRKTFRNFSEISPALTDIMAELDRSVNTTLSHTEKLEVIQDEINRLEEETLTRITYIKSLIKDLDS